MLGNETWTRLYFVLTSAGNLYTYKNKAAFLDSPNKRVYGRPFELQFYEVTASDVEIQFELKDKDEKIKTLLFRCDTDDEVSKWILAFDSFNGSKLKKA